MSIYVLGIGSNLNNPKKQIIASLKALESQEDISCITTSSLYQSPALTHKDNPSPQPDFINTVTAIKSNWLPDTLLNWIQQQEYKQGRVKNKIWDPRPIDIDMLFYENISYKSNRLTIPHPQIALRDFVILPLQEILHKLPKYIQNIYSTLNIKNLTGECKKIGSINE